jgi:hypothetical protein
MKLILKRVPVPVEVQCVGEARVRRYPSSDTKERPFALYTEDGVILPKQRSVTTESVYGECPTVTVTFSLDGEYVKVQGDD